jgi:glutathione S-transferase
MTPIVLYSHHAVPNPKKVAMVPEELYLAYETKLLEFPEMKQSTYESVNPSGRVPAIEDPNTGINLWESGAIIEYLVSKYDKSHKISFETDPGVLLCETMAPFPGLWTRTVLRPGCVV